MQTEAHRPVLLEETLRALACRPGGLWVDGTVGGGGHAEAIVRATGPDGLLLGCDRDARAIEIASRRLRPFGERVILRQADHRTIPAILDELGLGPPDGFLLDLGVSSLQLEDPARGFSYRLEGPLDMRMDRTQVTTASELVNHLTVRELASILRRYGEESNARRIAEAIGRARRRGPIATTTELASLIAEAGGGRRGSRIHPATRVFQALRIAVNQEIDGLDLLLEDAALRLRPGGRLAAISFHSLEDRVVKKTFAALTRRCICPRDLPICACGRPGVVRLVTRGAVRPGPAEIQNNPRSRSARLRAAERLPAGLPSERAASAAPKTRLGRVRS